MTKIVLAFALLEISISNLLVIFSFEALLDFWDEGLPVLSHGCSHIYIYINRKNYDILVSDINNI